MTENRKSSSDERRSLIAAAAIQLIAARGLRALTHRAVDAAAGMSPGSVNYHAPTRRHLIQLAAEDLFARDYKITVEHFRRFESTDISSTQALADLMARYIERLTKSAASRQRVIARHILLGEAQSDSDLRGIFDTQRGNFTSFSEVLLEKIGDASPSITAEALALIVESLISRQVIVGSSPLDARALRATLERLLQSAAR